MAARDIFRSDNLLVRAAPAEDRSRWVICFDHYDVDRALDRICFGETFLRARRISAVLVTCAGNDWYQYPEMEEALAAIRGATEGTVRMAYGSSMGGYAAIRFADRLGADRVLALSPQYSNDPATVPFEKRWEREARSIRWRPALDGPIRSSVRPIIVHDPVGEDGRHVALIAADIAIDAIRVPHSAHPVAPCLDACAMLEPLVMGVFHGRIDPASFEREARRKSRGSAVVLSELCRRQPAGRLRTAIALGRRAVALAPDNPLVISMLALRLTEAGEHEEAIALHEQAMARGNGFVGYRLFHAMAMHEAERNREALRLTDALIDSHPHFTPLQRWRFRLLRRSGRKAQAIGYWLRTRGARRAEASLGRALSRSCARAIWTLATAASMQRWRGAPPTGKKKPPRAMREVAKVQGGALPREEAQCAAAKGGHGTAQQQDRNPTLPFQGIFRLMGNSLGRGKNTYKSTS